MYIIFTTRECVLIILTGCVDLLHTIQTRVKPKYHIFGHIHEGMFVKVFTTELTLLTVYYCIGYGITTDGVTTYVNASTCNLRYQPINPAIIIDLPVKQLQ